MTPFQRYLLYSTTIGIFTGAFLVKIGGVQIIYFYFLMGINLGLMMLVKKLWVPSGLVYLAAFLALSGVVGLFQRTDAVGIFSKEFIGIVISAFYFTSFVKAMNYDLVKAFRQYAQVAYWVSVLGFFIFPFHIYFLREYRFRSIAPEPAAYATICLPALYYYADQWQRNRRYGRRLLVLMASFVLAGSSVGFIGILFGLCLFGIRYKHFAIFAPIIAIGLGFGIYTFSTDFQTRLDDTLRGFKFLNVDDLNLSSYALISNVIVAEQVFMVHPVLGNGLGSHPLSHETYIDTFTGASGWGASALADINANDGAALAIRTLSELGLIGLLLEFWFIWHFRPRGKSEVDVICYAIGVYFFVKFMRSGLYFNLEQFFFLTIYAVARNPKFLAKQKNRKVLEPYRHSLESEG